jgi:4-amino-4-deoxy-L-arabinose transferase
VTAWAALGAGFLTKGPVVLLWTVLPLLVWAAWTRSWRRVRRLLAEPLGVAAFALLALPWYLAQAAGRPGLLEYWLGGQIETRITAPYRGEREPWWTYLVTLSWAAWLWIVPAAITLARLARSRRPGGRFLVVWVVVPLLALSLFPTKRANYVLPALPAIAMAAGLWWDRAIAGVATGRWALPRALGLATGLLGAGLAIASFLIRDLPPELPALGRLFGTAFLLAGVAAWLAAGRQRLDLAFAACLLPLLGLYLGLLVALSQPRVEAWSKISRPIVREIAAHRLADEPIVNYHVWLRAIPFYLDERVITVSSEGRPIFGEDEQWREFTFTADSSFFRRMEEPPRILAVVRRSEVDDIERALGRRVAVLARDRRVALITNRPTPDEIAGAGVSDPLPAEAARSGRLGP